MKNFSKWQVLLIAIAAIIVLSAAAIYYYYTETKEIRKEKYQYLQAIAELKIDQISKWRNERLSEAEFFPTVGRFIKSTVFLSENPNDEEAKNFLMQTLDPIKQRHNYKNLLITDLNNRILFSVDPDEKKLDSITISYSKKSVELDSVFFTDFYYCKTHSSIHLDIVSPIKDNAGSIIGTFILRFDPKVYLFPLIQDWPTPTKTAESIIFKKENDQIRFISDLKYKNNYEMNFTVPLKNKEYVAVKGALGGIGIVDGIDYRGVEVLADLNNIPGTDWFFVSKIDKDEIYSEMFFRSRAISLLTVVTFLFVMALAMYLIRSKQTSTYKNLFLKEKELSDAREEFKTALYSIGDAVITTDSAGRIRYMNGVAEQITGWNEIEARGQKLSEVFKIVNEDSNLKVENPVDRVLRDGTIVGLANHTMLIKKDGTRIPISDSGSPIKDDNNKVIGVVLVFRDQTDERAKEKSILESNDKFSKIFNSSSESISLSQMGTGKVVEINEGFVEMFGYSRDEVIGFSTIDLGLWNNPADREQVINILKTEGRLKNFEAVGKNKNGKLLSALISGEIIQIENIPYLLLTIRDITERKIFEESLKASEEKYRMLIENQNDLVVKVNPDGLFTFVSPSYCKLFGKTEDELLGNSFVPLIHEDDREPTKQAMQKLYKEPFTCYIEQRAMTSNGWRWIAWSDRALLNSNGEIDSIIGVGRDVTDRKIFEESQKASEEKYRMLLDFASDAFFQGDSSGNFITVNNKAIELTGFSREELLGMNMKDLFSKELLENTPLRYDKLLAGETIKTERVVIKRDGEHINVEMTSKQMPNGTYQSFMRDITEIKKSEKELAASQERFRKAFTTSPDSININRLSDGIYVSINNGFTKMTGYTEEEVIGKTSAEIQIWADIKYRNELVEKLKTTSVVDNFEAKFRMKDGIIKDGLMSAAVIELNGEPHIISITRDITERKQAEERLEQFFSVNLDLLCIADVEGNFIKVNKAWEDILGYSVAELEHRKFLEFVHPEDIDLTLKAMSKLEKQEQVLGFINRYRCMDGSYRFLEWRSQPSGNLVYAAARDISDRKQAEEFLINSEKRFKSVWENTLDAMRITDETGKIILVNRAFCDLVNKNREELEGFDLSIVTQKEFREETHDNYVENFRSKNIQSNYECSLELWNEKVLFVQVAHLYLSIPDQPVLLLTVFHDISERKKAEEEILKTKIHFQKLIENAPDGIVQISAEGEFKYVSPSAKRIFGHPPDERIDYKPHELTHPEDLPKVLNVISDLMNNPSSVPTIEYRFKDFNGNYLWIESTFTNLLNEPNVQAIVINFRDINFRKTVEAKLRTLSQAVEQSPVIIVITDLKGSIEYVNPKFTQVTGYRLNEVKDKNVNVLKSDVQNHDLFKNLWQTILAGNTWRGEILNKKKDGKLYWEETVISPIHDSNGNIINFISVGEDITERKKLLTEIISSEEKFRSIWENSVDAMRLVDEKGIIINVNDSYCNLFGLSKDQLIGKLFNVSYIITESDTSLNGFEERFNNGTILKKFETEIQLISGKVIWVELTNSFIEFEDKPTMLLSIIRDITDRKVLITELTDAKLKAEEMIRLKSYFFANMSHELRTPFVGILGFAEILKDTLKNAEEREYAEQILKSSKRLTDTLNKILNVTRLEFDKVDLKLKEFDICSLLKTIEAFYHNSAKLNNTTINSVLEQESIIIKSDAKLLEDVLNNLVNNAVKFTHDGFIKLSASKILTDEKSFLVIKVEDNGIGIPKEKQLLVWQEFRQASEGLNRSFEGTGLGLTITKKYVEILGGEISLESEENIGTTFTIKLPAADQEINVLEQESIIHQPVSKAPDKPKNKRHKILYVEDDVVALQFINIILKSMYDVETAFKATAALELVSRVQYDVLMLDINLGSGMDGVELMQKIRQMDYYKNIPIVAITAYAAQSDKKEFLDKGFTHYISKPFTKNELYSLLGDIFS